MQRDFQLVDVFGAEPFAGNPLAVIMNGEGLDTAQMLRITQWFNLSETAFLLPATDPEADYRVRIFTLDRELPFAGHPTLGSCHAWLAAGNRPRSPDRIVQQCGAGLVPIRHVDGRLAFAGPELLRSGSVDEQKLAEVACILHIERSDIVDAQWTDNGPGWVSVMLASAEDVLALNPARSHQSRIEIGVIGPYPAGSEADYEVRAIFSDQHGGLVEDPVTGSLNAGLAGWLYTSGRVTSGYVASQGTALGRKGRVHVSRSADGAVWIAGDTVTLFSGHS